MKQSVLNVCKALLGHNTECDAVPIPAGKRSAGWMAARRGWCEQMVWCGGRDESEHGRGGRRQMGQLIDKASDTVKG